MHKLLGCTFHSHSHNWRAKGMKDCQTLWRQAQAHQLMSHLGGGWNRLSWHVIAGEVVGAAVAGDATVDLVGLRFELDPVSFAEMGHLVTAEWHD